jgi:hypothetical protein
LNPANHLFYEYQYLAGERILKGSGFGSIGLTDYGRLKIGFRFRTYYHTLLPFVSSPELSPARLGAIIAALFLAAVGGVWRFAYLGMKR